MIRPDFYDKFSCIADKCDFNCCQEWKISVDEATAALWKKTTPPAGMKTRRKTLEQFTQFVDGQRVVGLLHNSCPFFDGDGLCRLVKTYGDQVLSQTCQTFPREIHEFEDRTEATLMPCCPAVIDLINGEKSVNFLDERCSESKNDYLYNLRALLMKLMADEKHPVTSLLLTGFYVVSELNANENLSADEAFSYVDEIIETIEGIDLNREEHFVECNELFLDLIENYRAKGYYGRFLEPLSALAEGISSDEIPIKEYTDAFEEEWKKYEPLFRKLLVLEIFADLINIDSTLEDVQLRLQWLGMEYALMRHMCFLHMNNKANMEEQNSLNYKAVRNYIVLASRIMGYDQDDIYDYLENSFENILWDWGYFALIIGK